MDNHAVIASESARFREVLTPLADDAAVPTCSGWTAADLAHHLAEVQWFWARVAARGITTGEQVAQLEAEKPAQPATLGESLAILEAATAELLTALGNLDDDEARWTWFPGDQSAGFIRRMQTYEATFHRLDAERAAGAEDSPISTAVAQGALRHAFAVMWSWVPEWGEVTWTSTVEVAPLDTGDPLVVELGRWRGVGPDSGTAYDEPCSRISEATGSTTTATARGTCLDLALWAWGRGGTAAVDGEPETVAALEALVAQGMR